MSKKLIFSLVLAIGLVLQGCGSKQETTPASKKSTVAKLVKIQPVKTRTMVEKLNLPGSIQAENVANVLSTAEGKISTLLVREGDAVKANQVVAKISSLLREDIINSARLLIQTKKAALAKNPDDAKLKQELQQAVQDYEFALQQYREIPVTSPISGVVSKRWVDIGDMIPAKAKLFEIQSSARLRVDVPVSELDIRKLKMGQAAEILADACPDKTFHGTIQRIYPQVDSQTRNGMVEIRLNDPCPNLKPGMFVRVSFVTRTLKDVAAIPVQAVIERPKNKTCFIVNGNKAEEKIIKTGLEADGWVEILSGISVGDKIVVEGQQHLKTGAAVKIQGEKKAASQTAGGDK